MPLIDEKTGLSSKAIFMCPSVDPSNPTRDVTVAYTDISERKKNRTRAAL